MKMKMAHSYVCRLVRILPPPLEVPSAPEGVVHVDIDVPDGEREDVEIVSVGLAVRRGESPVGVGARVTVADFVQTIDGAKRIIDAPT